MCPRNTLHWREPERRHHRHPPMPDIEIGDDVKLIAEDGVAKQLERSGNVPEMIRAPSCSVGDRVNRMSIVVDEHVEVVPVPLANPAQEELRNAVVPEMRRYV